MTRRDPSHISTTQPIETLDRTTYQALLFEMADKLYFVIEERAGYCAQLDVEQRHHAPGSGSDCTEQIIRRTASIVELATALAGVARAANAQT